MYFSRSLSFGSYCNKGPGAVRSNEWDRGKRFRTVCPGSFHPSGIRGTFQPPLSYEPLEPNV